MKHTLGLLAQGDGCLRDLRVLKAISVEEADEVLIKKKQTNTGAYVHYNIHHFNSAKPFARRHIYFPKGNQLYSTRLSVGTKFPEEVLTSSCKSESHS